MKTVLLLLGIFSVSASAWARIGVDNSGGGDLCESRIYDIRNDISAWVSGGGYKELLLPSGISEERYLSAMQSALGSAKVSCVDETLRIGSSEKTCINSTEQGETRIRCNASRMSSSSFADQYVLIHHEYASLAGLEVSEGEVSHYEISNQLTEFLEQTVVTKLAIKPKATGTDLMDCTDTYTSSFSARIKDGKIFLRFEALGYVDRLVIAEKLGLPKEKIYSVLELNVPETSCVWAAGGRLSCEDRNSVLVFKNKQGDAEGVTAFTFDLIVGEVGIGPGSYRRVELSIEKDRRSATEAMGYRYCYGTLAR
ncbi:MAG: hypothetical protein AB7K68_16265 [Bacteriovoracia bacterium]